MFTTDNLAMNKLIFFSIFLFIVFVEDTPLKYKEVSKNDKFPYSFSYFKNPKVNNFQYDLGNNQKPKTFQKSFAKSKCIVCEIFVKAIR